MSYELYNPCEFDTKESLLELAGECYQEIKREEFLEQYRLICINMEEEYIYFQLFNTYEEMCDFVERKQKGAYIHTYLILPNTSEEEVKFFASTVYSYYYRNNR